MASPGDVADALRAAGANEAQATIGLAVAWAGRFWSRVGPPEHLSEVPGYTDCWPWLAGRHPNGYGRFWLAGRYQGAHRLAHKLLVGPIPEGLVIDHLCRVPCCVNPRHMEPVTSQENTRWGIRGVLYRQVTHCAKGHPYDEANTYVDPHGYRNCRRCQLVAKRASSGWLGRVSPGERTHCPKGHPYDETNTYRNPTTGKRACRLCRQAHNSKTVARRAQERAAARQAKLMAAA